MHIIRGAHKAMGYEVDILVDSEMDITLVFLRQGRQVDMLTRHIDTLMGTKHPIVLYLDIDSWTFYTCHLHADGTIIEKNIVTHLHILRKVGVRDIDDVVCRVHLGSAEDLHRITRFVFDRLLDIRRTYLRAFGINKDTDMRRYGTRVLDDITDSIRCSVRRIHSHDIHSGIEKATDEVDITTAVADRAYYFCLFHETIPNIIIYCKDTVFFPFLQMFKDENIVTFYGNRRR